MEKFVGFLFGKQLQCKEVSPAYTYNHTTGIRYFAVCTKHTAKAY